MSNAGRKDDVASRCIGLGNLYASSTLDNPRSGHHTFGECMGVVKSWFLIDFWQIRVFYMTTSLLYAVPISRDSWKLFPELFGNYFQRFLEIGLLQQNNWDDDPMAPTNDKNYEKKLAFSKFSFPAENVIQTS